MATRSPIIEIRFVRDFATGDVRMLEATERIYTDDGYELGQTITWLKESDDPEQHPELPADLEISCGDLIDKMEDQREIDWPVT